MHDVNHLDEKSTPSPVSNATSRVYNVHGHWAKRPFNVVRHCIQYFTKPGEIVLDPFVGFGTTGIEALALKRKAVITDLCPVSLFIARSVLEPMSPPELTKFEEAFNLMDEKISEEIHSLYETRCSKCAGRAIILTTIFDSKGDVDDPRERKWTPERVTYVCKRCGRRSKEPDSTDRKKIKEIENMQVPYPYPKRKLIYNTRKSVYADMYVEDVYTRRNLIALTILRSFIFRMKESSVKTLMKFTFSGILRSAAMFVHEGGGGWQKSFHVPKTRMAERNVWEMFERKKNAVHRCKEEIWKSIGSLYKEADNFSELENDKTILLKKWDATEITKLVPRKSIDYIHTDPPYGDNVQYLELFLPHIAWLDLELDENDWNREIVITDSPEFPEKRKVNHYHDLLVKAFIEAGKTLRPRRWATIWFACQDEPVWKALTDSIRSAGLERKNSYLVPRTAQQKSFGIKIHGAKDPLAKILKSDLLVHAQKTGEVKLELEIANNTAIRVFLEVAEKEIARKGSATTGELYLTFVNKCLKDFGHPPPNLNYREILKKDSRFVAEKEIETVKGERVEAVKWKLKGYKHPEKITSYLQLEER